MVCFSVHRTDPILVFQGKTSLCFVFFALFFLLNKSLTCVSRIQHLLSYSNTPRSALVEPYFGLLLTVLLTLWKNGLFARIGRRYPRTEQEGKDAGCYSIRCYRLANVSKDGDHCIGFDDLPCSPLAHSLFRGNPWLGHCKERKWHLSKRFIHYYYIKHYRKTRRNSINKFQSNRILVQRPNRRNSKSRSDWSTRARSPNERYS